ncbi:hypothetical protein BJF93_19520 [Xaviernesmea oryzae]|uniref:Uncharacterized protein n=1 Tax=Xaviernesmea oryzae TaxID=464029 RepID=A0A1Q9B1I9_9HYPH|nr:hypothetical protein BJF93_19520 [Xaviernesmea oryzae]
MVWFQSDHLFKGSDRIGHSISFQAQAIQAEYEKTGPIRFRQLHKLGLDIDAKLPIETTLVFLTFATSQNSWFCGTRNDRF